MSSIALLSEASYTCPWLQNSLRRNADLLLYSGPALIESISSTLEQQLDALQAFCRASVMQQSDAESSLQTAVESTL